MKIAKLLVSALVAGAPLAASAAPTVTQPPNRADAPREAVREHRAFRPTPEEAAHMRNEFQLDDGRVLKITADYNRLYAELDDKVEELVPVALNTFATRDGATRIVFNRVPYADEVTVKPVGP